MPRVPSRHISCRAGRKGSGQHSARCGGGRSRAARAQANPVEEPPDDVRQHGTGVVARYLKAQFMAKKIGLLDIRDCFLTHLPLEIRRLMQARPCPLAAAAANPHGLRKLVAR